MDAVISPLYGTPPCVRSIKEFATEHPSGYAAVIGIHVDREHIHAHTIFNSIDADTGEKYRRGD